MSFESPAARSSRIVRLRLAVLLAVCLVLAGAQRAAAASPYVQSVVPLTLPAAAVAGEFEIYDVACNDTDVCVVAGSYQDSSSNEQAMVTPIIDGVPGAAETVTLPPDADTSSQNASLVGASCQANGSCTAFGSYLGRSGELLPMVVQVTGGVPDTAIQVGGPTDETAPDAPQLAALSCPPTGACIAVGSYDSENAGTTAPMVVPINAGVPQQGEAVTLPANVDPSNPGGALGGVDCPSASSCVAVGDYYPSSGSTLPLVLPISDGVPGTGTAGSIPAGYDSSDPQANLQWVSCPVAGFCEAAGYYSDATLGQVNLVMPITGDVPGSPAEVVAPPDYQPSQASVSLTGLSCSTESMCVGAGYYSSVDNSISGYQAAVITIDGSQAASHEATLPTDASTSVYDAGFNNNNGENGSSIGCTPSGPCLAIGSYSTGSQILSGMLAQVSPGGVLGAAVTTPVPSDINSTNPHGSGHDSLLTGIGCDAYGSCAVLGTYYSTADAFAPLELTEQAPLAVTTSSLPGGTQGTAYPSALLAATGAWGVYSWSVSSGSLPAGLSLNSQTGVISGTPTGSGTATFAVTVTGTGSPVPTASQQLSLTVAAAAKSTSKPTPVLRLLGASGKVSAGKLGVKLACSRAACSGTVKLEITKVVTVKKGKKRVRKHKTVAIGSVHYAAAAGATKTLKLTLDGTGKKALKAAKKHRLAATLLATVKAGKNASRHETVYTATKKKKRALRTDL
ncbi:MAG TPA: Ig domain-containing protein [Solirubrobacteraceae bacterium]|nr:Ig domain-containing protein [Solirubrobacteraceae bacterium]